jgi:hypothetical protein
MATSAIWKVTYRARRTIFARISISVYRSVVNDQCFTHVGRAEVVILDTGIASRGVLREATVQGDLARAVTLWYCAV